MSYYLGIDIGGTKCAVVVGNNQGEVLAKTAFPTKAENGPEQVLEQIFDAASALLAVHHCAAIGISCGGPLNGAQGLIHSPPNLPGWDRIPITKMLEARFGLPAFLQNDADACALAEWRYGAGRGSRNMVFLTFGTGMGAGLILNGRLYTGACNMAGEVGHVRLFGQGHVGYGKAGSFEGCCSGGGIAQYGLGSAAELAQRAMAGDNQATDIYAEVGRNLGWGLAILVDILNPEVIVLGGIYMRSGLLMEDAIWESLRAEALPQSLECLKILPAQLGEAIGDTAALCVAMNALEADYRGCEKL